MNASDSESSRLSAEHERLEEEAALWSERLRDNRLLQKDFDKWVGEDPRRLAAFERIERARGIAQLLADEPELRALRDEAKRRAAGFKDMYPWTRWQARHGAMIAAGVAIFALAGVALWSSSNEAARGENAPAAVIASAPEHGRFYETAIGERMMVTLEDASVLTLDTASRAWVSYSERERAVRLDSGQAFFKVAHDARRPFVVTAGDTRVVAVGTEFDVRVSGDNLAVTLVTGRVRVEPSARHQGERRPLAILVPGQRYLSTPGGQHQVLRSVDTDRATAWRHGQVIFERQTLAEAIAEMNRYARRQIVLRDPELARLPVAGAFETGQSDAFVEALIDYFPIEVVAEDDRQIVLGRAVAAASQP